MPRENRKGKARSNGEGTIFKRTVSRKDGSSYVRWEGSLSLGYKTDGKRNRSKTYYGQTQEEIRAKLEEAKRQLSMGTYIDTNLTVQQYMERWIKEKTLELAPGSIKNYTDQANNHIYPAIGNVKLAKLSPMHLQTLCSVVAENVGKRMAELVRLQLHGALLQAVRWQIIPRNPADAVTPIKVPKKPVKIWTPTEVVRFLDVAREDRLYALFIWPFQLA
jgi:integrase